MVAKVLGFVSGFDSYKSASGDVVTTSVACGSNTFNCRGDVEDGLVVKEDVVIIGTLQVHPKGCFFKNEKVRRATPQEVVELS